MTGAREPVHVVGEVVATRRVGAYRHVTLAAPGVPERFRAGNFVVVAVPGHVAPRPLWIHRVRESSAYGPTLDVVVDPRGDATAWLASLQVGAKVAVTGPLGRAFALPRDPARCLLVGEERGAAALFPLAERLRERGASVTLAVGAREESRLLSTSDARRWVRSVSVFTEDGSVGIAGAIADHVADLVARSEAEVVYAAASHATLQVVASVAESAGVWSQVAVETPMACGTGLCHGCVLPVVGEDGIARTVRTCVEGPVLRGDRVRWEAL